MESKRSPSVDNDEPKTTFRKPTNDGGNRKYRRRTPVSGSSSSDESHKCYDISSRMLSKEDKTEKLGRKYTNRDDRGYNPSEHVRKSESSRFSSRGSQGYDRHDEHKSGKHVPEEDRNYSKLSSRPSQSDHRERRSEFGRSRDHYRDVDKYSRNRDGSDRRHGRHNVDESAYDDRDRSSKDRDYRDEKRDSQRISRDHKRYEESRGHRDDTNSKGETSRHLLKDVFKNELKTEGDKRANEEWKKADEKYHNRWKETDYKDSEERSNDVDADVTTKRQKFSSCDNADPRTDGSKQSQEDLAKSIPDQANISECGGDVDAAKDAAMKAAALVNQNLYGAGTMTADQKKKLLWGNKKKNTAEETSQRWTTAIFPDHERQEKFNKLMSLRLPWYIWPIVGCERRLQGRTEANQRPHSSRESSNRFREAVHCWAQAQGWPYCRSRSLNKVCLCLSSSYSMVIFSSTELAALYLWGNLSQPSTLYISIHVLSIHNSYPWKLEHPFVVYSADLLCSVSIVLPWFSFLLF